MSEAASKNKLKDVIADENLALKNQMKFEALLEQIFVVLLVFSSTYTFVTEIHLSLTGGASITQRNLIVLLTCEILLTTGICSVLGRSELRGMEENQVKML